MISQPLGLKAPNRAGHLLASQPANAQPPKAQGADTLLCRLAVPAGRLPLAALAAVSLCTRAAAHARPEGVNRPELLPPGEVTTVIDVAGFLAPSEEATIKRWDSID